MPRRYVTATCLMLRQLALYNGHLPLFPTVTEVNYKLDLLKRIKIYLVQYIVMLKLVYREYKLLIYKADIYKSKKENK